MNPVPPRFPAILLCLFVLCALAAAPGHAQKTRKPSARPPVADAHRKHHEAKDEDDIEADAPENEARFNRELWESIRKTPYTKALAYVERARRTERIRQEARPDSGTVTLPNGWKIAPAGTSVPVGRFPAEAVAFAGKIVVLNTGYYSGTSKPEISVVDPDTMQVVQTLKVDALFPSARVGEDGDLYVSGGFSKQIYRFDSHFALARTYKTPNGYTGALSPLDGDHLAVSYLVASASPNDYDAGKFQQGRLAILNTRTGMIERDVTTGYFPYALRRANGKLYVALLGEDAVRVYTPQLQTLESIPVGRAPQDIAADPADPTHLFVVNANSDSVSVIDTQQDTVVNTIDLRASGTRFGGAPTSCAVGTDHLFVTLTNTNSVAVLDRKTYKTTGFVPTGWYPTKVLLDEKRLYLLSAKGIRPRHPNPHGPQPTSDERNGPDYILTLLRGSLSAIGRDQIDGNLSAWTQRVREGSPLFSPASGLKLPIRYVFYIVRENRSYDQVMGDLGRGNGDPKLTLFGRANTPNAHRFAEQFVTLDNYFADGEMSVLGHSFTTSGYASPFLEWLGNAMYAGKYKGYPFGSVPAATSPAYLWDALDAHQIDYRIYGENYYLYTRGYRLIQQAFGPDSEMTKKFYAQMMVLASRTDRGKEFFQFASAYYPRMTTPKAAFALLGESRFSVLLSQFLCGDNSLSVALNERPELRRLFAEYLYRYPSNYRSWDLSYSDLDRFQAWKTDFEGQIKRGQVAQLQYLWLPNDHTAGVNPRPLPPQMLVAQNDVALARIVQTIAQSPIWKESLILVTEDDAQNGPDHVDGTRTVALAIGPYVKRGAVVSDRYDQLSLLRTIELILGLDPLNRNDALAVPLFGIFTQAPNLQPPPLAPLIPVPLSDADRLLLQRK